MKGGVHKTSMEIVLKGMTFRATETQAANQNTSETIGRYVQHIKSEPHAYNYIWLLLSQHVFVLWCHQWQSNLEN